MTDENGDSVVCRQEQVLAVFSSTQTCEEVVGSSTVERVGMFTGRVFGITRSIVRPWVSV